MQLQKLDLHQLPLPGRGLCQAFLNLPSYLRHLRNLPSASCHCTPRGKGFSLGTPASSRVCPSAKLAPIPCSCSVNETKSMQASSISRLSLLDVLLESWKFPSWAAEW